MSNITTLPGVTVAIGTMLVTVIWTEPGKEIVQVQPGGNWGGVSEGAKRVERVAKQLAALAAIETGVKGYG